LEKRSLGNFSKLDASGRKGLSSRRRRLVGFLPREKGIKLSFPKEKEVGFAQRKNLVLNCLFQRRMELASLGTKWF